MVFAVEFWGVRGSIACPSPRHVAYGGNTSCLEVTAGNERVILDAGTGIRDLGDSMLRRDVRRAHLLLTHVHWDHINGFPFFAPGYQANRTFEIKAAHLRPLGGVREVLAGQMGQPTFPVPLETMRSCLVFEDFDAGDAFDIGPGVRVRTAPLNHPNGATGYRLEASGKAVCYVTDTEHVIGSPDQKILALIEGADLVVYDCTYTDDEFPAKVGWGHSTWQEAVRLCRQANVKQLAIFHHDPSHEDSFMADIEQQAREMWSGAIVAREGMRIELA
ncbi:MAG TPA: MBL fold metallo-hydrolase [Polyangiaceae bacterium]|jgi:phosphoribosyl 1,2-cyclic phosphodiesterase|nr:MBL fold metallo-hydrolase [Polyangiaceae bacterium]